MTADDRFNDLARHAEAIPPEDRDWSLIGGGEYITPIGVGVAPDDGGVTSDVAEFIAAANPATILRLIAENRDLSEQLAQAYRDEVLAHDERDALAARLAAVEALADDQARPFPDGVPDREGEAIAREIRAALSAAPTDTTKETDR